MNLEGPESVHGVTNVSGQPKQAWLAVASHLLIAIIDLPPMCVDSCCKRKPSHAVVPMMLSEGLHTINWTITDGLSGCAHLHVEEEESGKAIRLIDAPVPVRENNPTVHVSSAKPGWPVPAEWTNIVPHATGAGPGHEY